MNKINYDAVDAAILAGISTGCHRMVNFENDVGVKQAVKNVHTENGMQRQYYRTIDARLQALKRQGKIEFFAKSGWRRKGESSHKASE
jgi:hypothetical protein